MKRLTMPFAAIAMVSFASSTWARDYYELVAEGYRWAIVNGPYACTTESGVQRITGHRTDAIELQMVEGLEAYYLIPGSIAHVVRSDPATGMSEIRLVGIARPLWTYSRFLSKRPIQNIYGVIETPENSGLIANENLGLIPIPGEAPDKRAVKGGTEASMHSSRVATIGILKGENP